MVVAIVLTAMAGPSQGLLQATGRMDAEGFRWMVDKVGLYILVYI